MSGSPILSSKLTSDNYKSNFYAGFIDKIILNAKSLNQDKYVFLDHFKSMGLIVEDGCFRGGGARLEVTLPNKDKAYLRYNYHSKQIMSFILNPSMYRDYNDFQNSLLSYLGYVPTIEGLPITRIDKTVEITLSLDEVLRGVDVKNKRSTKIYEFRSGIFDGLEVGKKPEVLKLYNKTKKAKLNFPVTRIEAYCIRNKIDLKTLTEMKKSFHIGSHYRDKTFDNICLSNLEFNKPLNKMQSDKVEELRILCNHLPFTIAKSLKNRNRNFDRDFGNLHRLEPWKIQPNVIFNKGVRNFFNPDDYEEEV